MPNQTDSLPLSSMRYNPFNRIRSKVEQSPTTDLPSANRSSSVNDEPVKNLFRSFWMAGYECADHQNAFGHRVDLLQETGHLKSVVSDYQLLKKFSIRTVREGIRWSDVEVSPYQYNWSSVEKIVVAADAARIQVIWDICHFGFPADLTPLHPMFARRFAALCREFIRFMRPFKTSEPLVIVPINEVSFLSWLGGDVRGTSPYCVQQGWEVKYRLMKAFIEGVAALKDADPTVRILTTEPLVSIAPNEMDNHSQVRAAQEHHENQFQVLDILSGRMCPELGGREEYLDLLGFNFYYNNEWALPHHETLEWRLNPPDPRWKSLSTLLAGAFARYGRPIVLTETSHPKEDRPRWITMIGDQCAEVIRQGVPLLGICWYPIIDRPDWDRLDEWHHAGLWDRSECGNVERLLHQPTADALIQAQHIISRAGTPQTLAV